MQSLKNRPTTKQSDGDRCDKPAEPLEKKLRCATVSFPLRQLQKALNIHTASTLSTTRALVCLLRTWSAEHSYPGEEDPAIT